MARQLRTDLIIGVKDMASGPLGKIKNNLRNFKAVNKLNLNEQFDYGERVMRRANRGAATFGVGLGYVASQGAVAAYQMEKMLNKLQAVGDLTEEQRKSFKKYAKELNSDFPYTNSEIIESAWQLAKSGLNPTQVRAGLPDALKLSMAGDIPRGEAADIATNVLQGMRLPKETVAQVKKSMEEVVDSLSYAANKSNTDVSKMGETFKYVAPLGAQMSLSLSELAAMSMAMANNGIRGSEAGTALRAAIVRLVNPTQAARDALDKLGLSTDKFMKMGKFVKGQDVISGLATRGINVSQMSGEIDAILKDTALQQKPAQLGARLTDTIAKGMGITSVVDLEKLNNSLGEIIAQNVESIDLLGILRKLREEKATTGQMAQIFSMKQSNRMLTLLTEDLDELSQVVAANSKGTADRMAKINMGGIVGQVARLNAAWTNLWVTLGESGVLDNIASAFEVMKESLEYLSSLSPRLLQGLTYLTAAIAIVGPLGLVLGGLGASLRSIGGLLRMTNSSINVFGKGMWGVMVPSTKAAGKGLLGFGKLLFGNGHRIVWLAGLLGAAVIPLQSFGLAYAAIISSIYAFNDPKFGGKLAKNVAGGFLALRNPLQALKSAAGGVGLALLGLGKMLNPMKSIKSMARGAVLAVRSLLVGAAALAAISWPLLLGGAAIAGVIGYWDELKAFFTGFFQEFDDAFEAEGLGRPLQAIKDLAIGIKDAISSALGYVGKLFGFGGDDKKLTSWMDAGARAARMLAKAVGMALKPIKEAYQWLSDLFGMGGKADAAKTAAPKKIPGRYRGGPMNANRPHWVGERGPELIVPSRHSFVVPNHKLGRASGMASRSSVGNVTVHVNINGSNQNAGQIGKEVGRQVQQALHNAHGDGGYA